MTVSLYLVGKNRTEFREEKLVAKPTDVLLVSELTSLKHGTELLYFNEESPFTMEDFSMEERRFVPRVRALYPRALGNVTVGVEASTGERYFGWLPISTEHAVDRSRLRRLGALTAEDAVCVDPAMFALGAIDDCTKELKGAPVLVTGLGALGLFAVKLLVAAGAEVHARSAFPKRTALAEKFGAHTGEPPRVAAAFECSGRYERLMECVRAVKQNGEIVTMGFYKDNGTVSLGREFFYNALTLRASLPAFSFGNRTRKGRDAKELQDAVIALMEDGALSSAGIVDKYYALREAPTAYAEASDPSSSVKSAVRY